ncbi:MAG: hypothetical protein R3B09_11675 [Nannocystaceae bacterium]
MRRAYYSVSAAIGLAIACTYDDPLPADLGVCADEAAELTPTPGLTYHADIGPLIAARCGVCHASGGIAPFALETYAQVYGARTVIDAVTRTREMPPWPPSRCCAEYRRDRSLSDDELAAIAGWVADGAPEGDPADAPGDPPPPSGLSRVDLEVTMPAAYTPSEADGDEVRCFVLDWPLDARRYITGLEVRPGDPTIAHHAIVYAVGATKAAFYQSLEDADDAPGWACPGGLFEGGDTVVGGWVPGTLGHDFPEGVGRGVEPGSKLILSVHYRFVPAVPGTDQTTLALRLDDAVDRELRGVAVFDPTWTVGETMKIPAGDDDVVYAYGYDPSVLTLGQPSKIYSVTLHMHERGASGTVAIERGDGSVECLLHVPAWDYHWQGDFELTTPVTIHAGDRVKVECHFDNSAGHQPPGQEPRDLAWGDDQEMCVASLLMTDP